LFSQLLLFQNIVLELVDAPQVQQLVSEALFEILDVRLHLLNELEELLVEQLSALSLDLLGVQQIQIQMLLDVIVSRDLLAHVVNRLQEVIDLLPLFFLLGQAFARRLGFQVGHLLPDGP